jgi:hypothetical protein
MFPFDDILWLGTIYKGVVTATDVCFCWVRERKSKSLTHFSSKKHPDLDQMGCKGLVGTL